MKFVNYSVLEANKEKIIQSWNNGRKNHGFGYFMIDGVLFEEAAESIYKYYPKVNESAWDNTTYINQRNKFTKTKFEPDSVFQNVFDEINGKEFCAYMSQLTGIENIEGDDMLFGGGLHQSITGAFLDVHVDFNIHEKTKKHRRMNAIIYMNKDWQESYNGYIELWNMKQKKQIENIAPLFNRMVVFETNEVSFHGHPKKLNTPPGISRKSLAVYYYTNDRPKEEIVSEHNTIYINTEGGKGFLKNLVSGLNALKERIIK